MAGPERSTPSKAGARSALPIGLIGLGKHGSRYLAHLRREVPELAVAAVCRRDEAAGRALAAEIGARFHREARELIADPAVRAVIAAAPPTGNAAIVEACVREQKPLLIEKPFAIDAEAAFRQRDLIESSGLPCLMGQTLRLSGVVQAVRALLPELGRLTQLVMTQSFEATRLAWLDDPAVSGGGNILHTGVHKFDLARYLTRGEVLDAACLVEQVNTRRTEDSFAASLRVSAGDGPAILTAVAASRATDSRAGEIRVVGERAQVIADHVHRELALVRGSTWTSLPKPDDVPTVREILRLFVPVAEGRMAPPITVRDGAAAVAIADACYRSAETGRRVAVRTG